jgi:hypothetical protein
MYRPSARVARRDDALVGGAGDLAGDGHEAAVLLLDAAGERQRSSTSSTPA